MSGICIDWIRAFLFGEIFMANGKAYNIAEVIAEGVNRLVESEVK